MNDENFSEVIDLFEIELRNLYHDRARELQQKISAVITSKVRVGQIIDPVFPRYVLLREHAENIGKDFLATFDSVINKYCGIITKPLRVKLVTSFYKQYSSALNLQEESFKRLSISLGRSDDFNSMFLPVKGIYGEFQHIYINRLESAVKRHNLEMNLKEVESNKEKVFLPEINETESTPQYKVAKDSVKKPSNLPEDSSVSKNTIIVKEHNGTVTELAIKALDAYRRKKFRSLKKACTEYAVRYSIDGKSINIASLYTIASDIQRGERGTKNKQK